MGKRKSLLIVGTVAVALIGVVSAVTLSNSKLKDITDLSFVSD